MKSKWIWPVLVLMALALSGCGFEIVDTGNRGLKVTFGEIVSEPLPEDIYFYNPLTSDVIELDIREQALSQKTVAYTKDVQQVEVTYTINFRPDPTQIDTIYRDIGKDWAAKLLPQIINGKLKDVVGTYVAVDLVGERGPAIAAVEKAIRESAEGRYIIVTRFEATDLSFTKEFEAATEAKVTAAQLAEKAINDTRRIKEEATQKVATAQGEATAIKVRSEALAKNPGLAAYEAVLKWDGKLPQYMLAGGALPFIDIGKK